MKEMTDCLFLPCFDSAAILIIDGRKKREREETNAIWCSVHCSEVIVLHSMPSKVNGDRFEKNKLCQGLPSFFSISWDMYKGLFVDRQVYYTIGYSSP